MKRAVALTAALLLPSVALAKHPAATAPAAATAGPSPAAKAAAKQHFSTAEGLFRDNKFDEAIAEYQAAYDAWPLDAFFFNIGQCHRNLGHVDDAITNFEKYLGSPSVKNRAEVESLLAELRAKKAETQVAATAPAGETKPASLVDEALGGKKTEAPKPDVVTASAAAVSPPDSAEKPEPTGEKKTEVPAGAVAVAPSASASTNAAGQAGSTEATPMYKKGWFWGAVVGAIVVVGGGVAAASLGSPHLPSGSLGSGDWR